MNGRWWLSEWFITLVMLGVIAAAIYYLLTNLDVEPAL